MLKGPWVCSGRHSTHGTPSRMLHNCSCSWDCNCWTRWVGQAQDIRHNAANPSCDRSGVWHVCSSKHSRTGSRSSSAPGTPSGATETLMQLTCRLSSLDYLLIRLPVLATSVRSRSA